MMNFYKIPMLILILVLLSVGCNNNGTLSSIPDIPQDTEIKTQQRSSSLLNMSDLEVIKKSADYLKSRGQDLIFQETEILYMDNDHLSPIFKNDKDEIIYYQGNYLVIHFYPKTESQELYDNLIVFIGDDGKVLGYTLNPDSKKDYLGG